MGGHTSEGWFTPPCSKFFKKYSEIRYSTVDTEEFEDCENSLQCKNCCCQNH